MKDLAPLNYPIPFNISLGGRGYAGTWRERKTRHGVRFGVFTFRRRGPTRTIALFPPPATRNAKTQEGWGGVSFRKADNRWRATYRQYLGQFTTENEARAAVERARAADPDVR